MPAKGTTPAPAPQPAKPFLGLPFMSALERGPGLLSNPAAILGTGSSGGAGAATASLLPAITSTSRSAIQAASAVTNAGIDGAADVAADAASFGQRVLDDITSVLPGASQLRDVGQHLLQGPTDAGGASSGFPGVPSSPGPLAPLAGPLAPLPAVGAKAAVLSNSAVPTGGAPVTPGASVPPRPAPLPWDIPSDDYIKAATRLAGQESPTSAVPTALPIQPPAVSGPPPSGTVGGGLRHAWEPDPPDALITFKPKSLPASIERIPEDRLLAVAPSPVSLPAPVSVAPSLPPQESPAPASPPPALQVVLPTTRLQDRSGGWSSFLSSQQSPPESPQRPEDDGPATSAPVSVGATRQSTSLLPLRPRAGSEESSTAPLVPTGACLMQTSTLHTRAVLAELVDVTAPQSCACFGWRLFTPIVAALTPCRQRMLGRICFKYSSLQPFT